MPKRLIIINSVLGFGSTGNIVLNIAREYQQSGYEVKAAYGRNFKVSKDKLPDIKKYGIRIGNDIDVYSHLIYSRLTDKHGLASTAATRKFLKWADEYDPDILWLHNIHGYYINYELLFAWIKSRPQMQVKWTLHDCWAFTGHCSHFTYVGCGKWKLGCDNCPQIDQYPKAITDNSADNYNCKKKSFTGVPNLTIVTPSNWLKEKVKQSFLSEYPVEVHYNTINTDIFKPTPSTFKQEHGIQDKKMILGVASTWNERKGLNDFIELARLLEEKVEMQGLYKIVLVGLSESQIKDLVKKSPNILAIPRTSSAKELAEIYTAAEVFVNPTYEDTFPSVNMEAEACGTRVITYDTGGCAETIKSSNSCVIQHGARNILYKGIISKK